MSSAITLFKHQTNPFYLHIIVTARIIGQYSFKKRREIFFLNI